MRAFLGCYGGKKYELPALSTWRMSYATGIPCDSFEVQCAWGTELEAALSTADRFWAEEGGTRVFTGVVDEYECAWGAAGGHLTIVGRGMAALLLDNEARAEEYQMASLDDILKNHVLPYGIHLGGGGALPAVPRFAVGAGKSEWQVLYDFARYHGGVEPWFNRAGRLMLSPQGGHGTKRLDDTTGLTAVVLRERRYGILSEVLVQNRAGQTAQRVVSQAQIDRGIRCRRVVTQPAKAGYQAMRYSAQFQLDRGAEGQLALELTAPVAFFLWPGDVVELHRKKPALAGTWRVREVETGADENGTYSKVLLGVK